MITHRTGASTAGQAGALPTVNDLARIGALFFGMLMSGGLFVFPRLPLLALIVMLCFYLKGPWLGLRRAMEPVALLLLIVFAVTLLGAGGLATEAVATRYLNFFGGLLLLGLYLDLPRETILRDLYLVGKVFAVQALLTLILAETATGLFTTVDVRDTPYQTIAFIFTYPVLLEESTVFFRPDGFFFEPGVFQIYTNIFLYLAIFVFRDWRWSIVGLLAVMAVQSTTGYIIALLLLAVAFVRYVRAAPATFKWAALAVAPLVAIPVVLTASQNFQTKFSGRLQGSAWAREYDTYTGLRVAAAYPLTGIGFDYERYYDEAARYGYLESQLATRTLTERPNSNGIVTMFYSIGFPLSLIFLLGLFRQIIFPDRLLFATIFILSLLAEALVFTPFFLMILFSGLLIRPVRVSARRWSRASSPSA